MYGTTQYIIASGANSVNNWSEQQFSMWFSRSDTSLQSLLKHGVIVNFVTRGTPCTGIQAPLDVVQLALLAWHGRGDRPGIKLSAIEHTPKPAAVQARLAMGKRHRRCAPRTALVSRVRPSCAKWVRFVKTTKTRNTGELLMAAS